MARLVLLEGPSLAALNERVLAEHGRHARIVSAERVVSGGIRGFFAKQHYEVTVELPEATGHGLHSMDLPTRVGLAALLDEADAAESQQSDTPAAAQPSTSSPNFAALLEQMTIDTLGADDSAAQPFAQPSTQPTTPPGDGLVALPASLSGSVAARALAAHAVAVSPAHERAALPAIASAARSIAPERLRNPGDLVLCIGARGDASYVARAWADAAEVELALCAPRGVAATGALPSPVFPAPLIADRRDALAARARGVERGVACIALLDLAGAQAEPAPVAAALREQQLGTAASVLADQLWVVVDVARKSEDTAAWVAACQEQLEIHGIIAIGEAETATPHLVHALGLPVRWHSKG